LKIYELIREAKNKLSCISESPHLEAEVLLSYLLKKSKEEIIAHQDDDISATVRNQFLDLVNKRLKHIPLHYILGEKEFMGLRFIVNKSVLVPRMETETLVEEALKLSKNKSFEVLDIGTGSGCILISFLYYNKNSKGVGVDISDSAISIAEENAKRHMVSDRVTFISVDFKEYTSNYRFDLILSNPPYVKTDELKNIKKEPILALDGGENGYKLYPLLIKKIYELLKIGGTAIVEIDYRVSGTIKEIFIDNGFRNVLFIRDLAGKKRFIKGEK
jgi:release factor glutamine methyltransferase